MLHVDGLLECDLNKMIIECQCSKMYIIPKAIIIIFIIIIITIIIKKHHQIALNATPLIHYYEIKLKLIECIIEIYPSL